MQDDELDELARWHDDNEDLEALCAHMDATDPDGRGEPKDREWYA